MENTPIKRIMYRPLNTMLNIWEPEERGQRNVLTGASAAKSFTRHWALPLTALYPSWVRGLEVKTKTHQQELHFHRKWPL